MDTEAARSAVGLREHKKALTREAIESTALNLFLERGYEQARLEDICADALISVRTFFRYFKSKEDLVFGRLHAHLALGEQLLGVRPENEPVLDSLRVIIEQLAEDYVAEPEREWTRLRLVNTTPVLQTGLVDVFAGFERLTRDFAASRINHRDRSRRAMLVAAAAVSAFRIGLETWIEQDTKSNLPRDIAENLDMLAPDPKHLQ